MESISVIGLGHVFNHQYEALSLSELEIKQETIITEGKGKIALKDLKGNK